MARKTRPIYDVLNGVRYDSVSAAAKALRIDASNINKVLNGKRASAGGNIFIDAKTYSSKTLKRKAENIVSSLTDNQMSKLAVLRGLNPQTVLLQRDLHGLIQQANTTLKVLEKKRLSEFVPMASDISISYSQYLGKRTVTILNERQEKVKLRLINGNMRAIQKLEDSTLNAIVQSLKAKLNSKSFTVSWASNEAERVGNFLGLNSTQIKYYRKIIPSLYDALHTTQYKTLDSDVLVYTVADMIDNRKSGDYIIDYLEKEKAYQTIRKDVAQIFHLSKDKFNEIDSVPGLIDNIAKILKIEQLHPENNNLHNMNKEIYKALTKGVNINKLTKLNQILDNNITALSLIYGKDIVKELDSMITYTDLLKFEEVQNR